MSEELGSRARLGYPVSGTRWFWGTRGAAGGRGGAQPSAACRLTRSVWAALPCPVQPADAAALGSEVGVDGVLSGQPGL